MTRANYKLKSFLSFLWLISYERFISIRNHTYDPNRQHLLDYTPSNILMSYRYLHILSILCRTSRYRQDSSHSPLIKIKNWLIKWPGPWPILYGVLCQFHKDLSWIGLCMKTKTYGQFGSTRKDGDAFPSSTIAQIIIGNFILFADWCWARDFLVNL